MELPLTILFGILSFVCAIAAFVFKYGRVHILSGVLGLATIAFITVSSRFWVRALVESGKNTRLLGYERYPAILYVVAALVAVGLFCTVAGIVGLVKKKRGRA